MTLDLRQRLLGTTLLASACLFAAPAVAQTQNPQEPGDANQTTSPVQGDVAPTTSADAPTQQEPAQDIVITGSRIPQPNLTSTSPVTVVSAQEVKLSGTARVEDLLNSLPQVMGDQGSTDSNGASGIATVNLRNLGSQRTLVLVNGRRMVPGDAESPVTDLNFIPASLIKRVDVLTGGASSVYGSDALAGVVNFIMDTTFTGIRLDAQASVFNLSWDARTDGAIGRLRAELYNRPGTLAEMAGIFAKNHANVVNLEMTQRENPFHTYEVDLEVRDLAHLTRIISALRASEAVAQAERI